MQKSVGLQFKLITIATLETSCILAILAKRAQEQSTKRQRACMKHLSTKVVDPKPTKILRSIKFKCFAFRSGRAQTTAKT